jgi:hypothetical protein
VIPELVSRRHQPACCRGRLGELASGEEEGGVGAMRAQHGEERIGERQGGSVVDRQRDDTRPHGYPGNDGREQLIGA